MSTITKEQLRERAREKVKSLEFIVTQTAFADSRAELEEELKLARIAQASLEAEPYGYVHKAAYEQAGSCGLSSDHEAYRDSSTHIAVYTTPPAPVSVPDEMTMQEALSAIDRLSWQECTRDAYMIGWNACRAAMLQGAENAGPPTTMKTAPALDSSPKIAESTSGNSPVIPDGWVACSERMPENDDFVYIWPRPDFGVELHVAQYGKFDKRDAGWYAQVYEQNYGIEYYPVNVTHWMPLPAAPQQEVKP